MKAIVVFLVALLLAAFMVGCEQYTQPTAPFGREGFLKVVATEAGAKIDYYVPSAGFTTISVRGGADQGQVVVLLQQERESGHYTLTWGYMIQEGVRCPPGKYDLVYTCVSVNEIDEITVP